MAVTTKVIDRARRDLDVSKEIARLYPDATPFAVILMKARKETTQTNYFYWYDSELVDWWGKVVTAVTTGSPGDEVTISVESNSMFRPKDLVKVADTDEVLYVTEITSSDGTDQIKAIRGYEALAAGATLTNIPENAQLLILGNAMEEFSSAPGSKLLQPTKGENFTQIFRTPFDQSMTSTSEKLRTAETERNRLRRDKAIEHRLAIERAMIFGKPYQDPNEARNTTGGVLHFIQDQKFTSNSTFDEDVFEDFCEKLFTHGSDKKLLICSHKVGAAINKFAKDNIETRSGEETYGLRLKQYKSFHGDLFIVPSRTLERAYQGLVLGLDMKHLKYRPLSTRDTTLKTNIQPNDADGWRDEYMTEAGLELRLPKAHAWMNIDMSNWTVDA